MTWNATRITPVAKTCRPKRAYTRLPWRGARGVSAGFPGTRNLMESHSPYPSQEGTCLRPIDDLHFGRWKDGYAHLELRISRAARITRVANTYSSSEPYTSPLKGS